MTGLIGDPTGRNLTRPPMTRGEIGRNAETYKAQVKILDPEKAELRFNAEWLAPLTFKDMIRLCSKYTVAQLLEREDFRNGRFRSALLATPRHSNSQLYPFSSHPDPAFCKRSQFEKINSS